MEEQGYGIKNVISCNDKLQYNTNSNITLVSVDGKSYGDKNKSILANVIHINDYIDSKPYEISYVIPTIIYKMFNNDDIYNNNLIFSSMIGSNTTGPFNSINKKINNKIDLDKIKDDNDNVINEHYKLDYILRAFYQYSLIEYNNNSTLFDFMIQYKTDKDTESDDENTLMIELYDNMCNEEYDSSITKRNIYSSYLEFIINRYINNDIELNLFMTDEEIIDVINKYDSIKNKDNLFNEKNKIYDNFCNINPLYRNISDITNDINKQIMIQKIINIIEPEFIIHHL